MPCASVAHGSAPVLQKGRRSEKRSEMSNPTTWTPTPRRASRRAATHTRRTAPRAKFRSDDEISLVTDPSKSKSTSMSMSKSNSFSVVSRRTERQWPWSSRRSVEDTVWNGRRLISGLRRSLSVSREKNTEEKKRRSRSSDTLRDAKKANLKMYNSNTVALDSGPLGVAVSMTSTIGSTRRRVHKSFSVSDASGTPRCYDKDEYYDEVEDAGGVFARLQQEEGGGGRRHAGHHTPASTTTTTTTLISPWATRTATTTRTTRSMTTKSDLQTHPFAQRVLGQPLSSMSSTSSSKYVRSESACDLDNAYRETKERLKEEMEKKRSVPTLSNPEEMERLHSAQRYIVDALEAFSIQSNDNDNKYPNDQERARRSRRPSRQSSGMVRRHSFSTTPRSSRVSESATDCRGQSRSLEDAVMITHSSTMTSTTSSASSSFVPLRQRLKGLFGSFGKGGNRRRNRSAVTNSSSDHTLSTRRRGSPSPSARTAGHGPVLKASLGEFTRQIERLTAVPNKDDLEKNEKEKAEKKADSTEKFIEQDVTGTSPLITLDNECSPASSDDEASSGSADPKLERRDSGQGSSPASGVSESSSTAANRGSDSRKVFFIANELMTSERVFVDVLRLLNVDFRSFVVENGGSCVIGENDLRRLFGNLDELQKLAEGLLADFEGRLANWELLPKIADVIVEKGPFLKLFTTYIREFSATNLHFDRCCQRSVKFNKLVQQFESLERCRHLKLKHFMLKPVQRLPQYKLLLEDYLKHLDAHNDIDFDDTTIALRIVAEAAERANDTIKQGDEFRRLLRLQSRLSDPDLIRPGRELLKEGCLMKISRKGNASARYFVLLSDSLLYCAINGSGLKVSYSIGLEGLQVRVRKNNAKVVGRGEETEFTIVSAVRSCVVRAENLETRNEWLDAINSAIEDHASRQASFATTNAPQPDAEQLDEPQLHAEQLHSEQLDAQQVDAEQLDADQLRLGQGDSRCRKSSLGKRAPVWIADREVSMCQLCAGDFGVIIRRHHCRACGRVVCHTCSSFKAPLAYRHFQTARVCMQCFQALLAELRPDSELRSRFKRRSDWSTGVGGSVGRQIPDRLRIGANCIESVQLSGFLRRRLKNNRSTRRMWYVLRSNVLYEYKASEDAVATDASPLIGLNVEAEVVHGEEGFGLCLWHHSGRDRWRFVADTLPIRDMWLRALSKAATTLDHRHFEC